MDMFPGISFEDRAVEVNQHNQVMIEKVLLGFSILSCKPVAIPKPSDLGFSIENGDRVSVGRPTENSLAH